MWQLAVSVGARLPRCRKNVTTRHFEERSDEKSLFLTPLGLTLTLTPLDNTNL
jgi:hypothetical protein